MDRKIFENLHLCKPMPPIELKIIDGYCFADKSGMSGHQFEHKSNFMRCRKCNGIYIIGNKND